MNRYDASEVGEITAALKQMYKLDEQMEQMEFNEEGEDTAWLDQILQK
eukprot:CAMPEP_0168616260 /NCGR_PEP_ID=MMETSP0449_2-20121227/4937_1 /TAXON_ID=1082188 /ORGANISM="Strombidium rassoulzadegani, Strain ras09" /LENGTH=47 /DNA_ID= /DNA_START= /DNA_END= /DNA_ORIENTATION=